jgi:hypothetical protein
MERALRPADRGARAGQRDVRGLTPDIGTLNAAFPPAPGPCALEEALESAERWAEARAAHVFRLIAAASKSS